MMRSNILTLCMSKDAHLLRETIIHHKSPDTLEPSDSKEKENDPAIKASSMDHLFKRFKGELAGLNDD
jgi:hypothetical protein